MTLLAEKNFLFKEQKVNISAASCPSPGVLSFSGLLVLVTADKTDSASQQNVSLMKLQFCFCPILEVAISLLEVGEKRGLGSEMADYIFH